jgi:hypothetical protein
MKGIKGIKNLPNQYEPTREGYCIGKRVADHFLPFYPVHPRYRSLFTY